MGYIINAAQHIFKYLPQLARGALVTIELTACTLLIGFSLGTVCGLLLYRQEPGSWLIRLYVRIIRGTPMLIQIMFFYYVLAMAAGLNLPAFVAATLAIGVNSGAYVTEIVRAGAASVDQGQIEAAHTLGIPRNQVTRYIILPQALQTIIPALGNEAITLVKDSSLASVIGVMELYKQGMQIISATYQAIPTHIAVGCMYLTITSILSYIMGYVEQYLRNICYK